jgi:hypothetical protein
MASKKLFGGVRMQLVGALVATVGGIALTACSSCCGGAGPEVYRKPCCAQSGGAMSCGAKSCGAAPAAAPAPAPKPAQMACGAGKCG